MQRLNCLVVCLFCCFHSLPQGQTRNSPFPVLHRGGPYSPPNLSRILHPRGACYSLKRKARRSFSMKPRRILHRKRGKVGSRKKFLIFHFIKNEKRKTLIF
jgi:hypothetical protein